MHSAKHLFYKFKSQYYVAAFLNCPHGFNAFEDAVQWVEDNYGVKFIAAAYMIVRVENEKSTKLDS